jgi:molybdopterin-binding protein
VRLASPVPLVVEITHRGGEAVSLGPGAHVWASLKATEITVQPD